MKSEDKCFKNNQIVKSFFKNDSKTDKNLSSSINIMPNNAQKESYYLGRNSSEKEYENISKIKDELECENDKNIDNFLTQDIINSINEMNFKSKNNLNQNKSIKEILIQDNTESYEDGNNFLQQKSKSDNVNIKNSKIRKDIINEFPFNLNTNKSSDFHINNNLTLNTSENLQIYHEKNYLNNENEEINSWNFNINPNEIFNISNQKDEHNTNENYKLNDNFIHVKNDVNNEKNNPMIKNKEMINLNEISQKNEIFKPNTEHIKMNNGGYLKDRAFFNNNYINPKFNLFQNQNNYINFDNGNNNIQNKNNYIENNFQ